jgi:predicted protein tyrosine phosphatase
MERFFWCREELARDCPLKNRHSHICIRSPKTGGVLSGCRRPTLYLAFHDLGENAPDDLKPGLFNEDQAREIVEFVEQHPGKIIVNCEAGVSRSPGVVLALRRHFGGNTEEIFQRAIPNIFVTSMLSRALTKKDKP